MSNVENGADRSIPDNPDPGPHVEPEIYAPRYPSLVCSQCQEGSLIHPVLPTAPYPVTPVLERVSYPVLPTARTTPSYYFRDMPRETQNDEKLVRVCERNLGNTSDFYNADVTPVIREATPDQTAIVHLETEEKEREWTRKYCSRICWVVGIFLIMIVIAVVAFQQFYHRYYRVYWVKEKRGGIYHHNYSS